MQVCTQLQHLVQGSVELQYIVELGLNHMIDGPRIPGSKPIAERLELLRYQRRRWQKLDWSKQNIKAMEGRFSAYEFVDGAFATLMWTSPDANRLNLTFLPSRDKEVASIEWDGLGFPVKDFAIDPSQDLMMLMRVFDHENEYVYAVFAYYCYIYGIVITAVMSKSMYGVLVAT
jgi:hypothetical protein